MVWDESQGIILLVYLQDKLQFTWENQSQQL